MPGLVFCIRDVLQASYILVQGKEKDAIINQVVESDVTKCFFHAYICLGELFEQKQHDVW